jgi:peptidoglycan-N-acetylmuramic acid deacetylase
MKHVKRFSFGSGLTRAAIGIAAKLKGAIVNKKGPEWKTGIIMLLVPLLLTYTLPVDVHGSQWSNSPIHWGFKKNDNHEPPTAGAEREQMLEEFDSFYLGDTTKQHIYLTFDNGYEEGYTDDILDVLKQKQVPAAFFITGHYIQDQPELVKRMVEEGHIVGNQSWSHPDLTTKNEALIREELQRVDEAYRELTGAEQMRYLRPPRGVYSERTLAISRRLGYSHVLWSLAFVDWHTDRQKGWEYAYDQIMSQIHPGAVILLHTVSRDNAEALAKVIDDLQDEGYEFRTLDDLMIHKTFPDSIFAH